MEITFRITFYIIFLMSKMMYALLSSFRYHCRATGHTLILKLDRTFIINTNYIMRSLYICFIPPNHTDLY